MMLFQRTVGFDRGHVVVTDVESHRVPYGKVSANDKDDVVFLRDEAQIS